METQIKWFRGVVAVAVIAALVIGAVNAVVFAAWRDHMIAQEQTIAKQSETIAQQAEAIEIVASGACYGYVANLRLDLAFVKTMTSTEDIVLNAKSFQACIATLMELTKMRQP